MLTFAKTLVPDKVIVMGGGRRKGGREREIERAVRSTVLTSNQMASCWFENAALCLIQTWQCPGWGIITSVQVCQLSPLFRCQGLHNRRETKNEPLLSHNTIWVPTGGTTSYCEQNSLSSAEIVDMRRSPKITICFHGFIIRNPCVRQIWVPPLTGYATISMSHKEP